MPAHTYHHLILFGDQTVEKLPIFENVFKHSTVSPLLHRFFHNATDYLQIEASKLPKEERAYFQDFHSLLELAQRDNDPESNEVVATVVLLIARLGELILHAERDSTILGSITKPTEILAFCTGGIPAAVAVVARDTEELLALSIESVGITLRLASALVRRSSAVDDITKPWAITCVGVTTDEVQPILDSFHKTESTPFSRRLSISVIGRGWLTIFGPPSTLDRLCIWSSRVAKLPKVPTNARSSVHASYLPSLDMGSIIGESTLMETPVTSKARMISPFTTLPYEANSLRQLLQQILPDIAKNAIYVEKTIAQALKPYTEKSILVSVMGKTQYLTYLEHELSQRHINHVMSRHDISSKIDGRSGSGAVAIVGMSGRFPGSKSVEELWDNLLAGKEFVTKIPVSRFNLGDYYDPTHHQKNSTATAYGAFLDTPGMFDHRLFNMSPREAAQIDPLMRLLLTTTYEALESAGYQPDATLSTNRNRVNTYFGQVSDDWRDVIPQTEKGTDIYYVPGVSRSFAPSRLNYHFKWGGGSYSIDNACASSSTCVSLACASLLARECDMAVAGGGSILQSPYVYAGLSRAGMLSPTGGCKTFRADADGYCRGEGIGVVILKRLEDALAEKDNVIAVIRGIARNYSNTATSMTHPSAEAQERLYRQVLRQASISPNNVSYVEMHGTGTQVGDFVEMLSVLNTFASDRAQDNPLAVGAIKANIGHGESAAGICSLIKTSMILRSHKIPPQPGMPFKLNPRFPDLTSMNIYIAESGMMLRTKRSGSPLRAFVNTFDVSGGNTCMVLEEGPRRAATTHDMRFSHVVVVTGKTKQALLNNRNRLLQYMKLHPDARVSDVAYTTTARRMHENLRVCYTTKSSKDLIQKLSAPLDFEKPQPSDTPSKVIFVFTGQGSQYPGMGRDLYLTHAPFRDMMQSYERIATGQGLPSFLHFVTDDTLDNDSQRPGILQVAIVSLEIAMANLWRSWGVSPDLLIGHSIGEYAALCVAGVLSVSDTLYLVGKRASLFEEKLTTGSYNMLVVRAGSVVVLDYLERSHLESCQISLRNSPSMTVVSGLEADIGRLHQLLISDSLTSTLLKLPYGFHSQQLDPVLDDFESIATGAEFSEPKIPVASTLLAKVCQDAGTFTPRYLRNQMRQAVDFVGTLQNARLEGWIPDETLFVELGPQPICSSLIAATLEPTHKFLPSLRPGENAWATISDSIAKAYESGSPFDWTEFHRPFLRSVALIQLPTYAFDESDFWTPFTTPPNRSSPDASSFPAQEKMEHLPQAPKIPGFPSSALQQILEWRVEEHTVFAKFVTNTSNEDFKQAVNGHIVNGFALVPASLLGEMAISAARYTQARLYPTKNLPSSQLSIHKFEISKPIVLDEKNNNKEIFIAASRVQDKPWTAIRFKIRSDTEEAVFGHCDVIIGDNSAEHAALSRNLFLIRSRMDSLKRQASEGLAHPLSKVVVYRLFENLVKVGAKSRAINSAILGSDFRDALAEVSLPSISSTADGCLHHYWSDALVQISGVLLNCGLHHPEDTVFISKGLGSWSFFEELKQDCKYTSYVQYYDMDPGISIEGDVTIFCEDRAVSQLRGVQFQMVNRKILTAMLSAGLSSDQSVSDAPVDRKPSLGSKSPPPPKQEFVIAESPGERDIAPKEDKLSQILEIIATESGAPIEDIDFQTRFKDIGIDSLMAITIGAAIKAKTNLDIPPMFFIDHPTINQAIDTLGLQVKSRTSRERCSPLEDVMPDLRHFKEISKVDKTSAISSSNSLKVSMHSDSSEMIPVLDDDPPFAALWTVVSTPGSSVSLTPAGSHRKQTFSPLESKVILLQGSGSSSSMGSRLFFIADETGTVSRYMQIPDISRDDMPVYGVLSPFVHDKHHEDIDIQDIVTATTSAIQSILPNGPFHLGGYSYGGIIAYLTALKLAGAGLAVGRLLLLDPPSPTSSTFASALSPEYLIDAGIIPGSRGSGQYVTTISKRSQEHVRHFLKSFMKFHLPHPPKVKPPKTTLLCAKENLSLPAETIDAHSRFGAGHSSRDAWLHNWKQHIPDIELCEVDGNHFTMLEYPQVDRLASALIDSLSL